MEFNMSRNSKTTKGATDLEELTRQLSALRDDMAKLAKTVAGIAGRRSSEMAADIAEGFSEAEHYIERKGRSTEAKLEGTVANHPLLALGLAVGAGLLVGALARR
jgi:ElaB/YqjD/DUF883 family membrane-anchored ribosome-binding protein